MMPQSTPQSHGADQQRHFLAARRLVEQQAKAAMHLVERQAKMTLPAYRWICGGCGMAHTRMLPEECQSCGATALEFEYSSPLDMNLHS